MNIIADKNKLKKDLEMKMVVERLSEIFTSDKEVMYYKYPIYRGDLPEDLVQAQLLVASPVFGVLYFYISIGKSLTKDDCSYLQNLDTHIYRRFIGCSELRKTKRELKFCVSGFVISDFTREDEDVNYVRIQDLEDAIQKVKMDKPLENDEFNILVSCIENTSRLNFKKNREPLESPSNNLTKGQILNIIQKKNACFDNEQRKVAMSCIDSPQRIRGLAGSGKTILLAMKAALFHLENPNAEILYTYYTKDLYDLIKSLIERFYREAADNIEPNWEKIHIYHAWGGVELRGVYSSACSDNNIIPITYPEARIHNAKSPFSYVCEDALKSDIKKKYDLTLIDEGQDFPYEFYQLCFRLSKSRRIVWAYDEFQNIFDTELQDERETFGRDAKGEYFVDFTKKENENQDVILHCSYRCPRNILIAAFALGMGIYGEKVLQRLGTNELWESLGFKVEKGTCKTGDQMIISRPLENTPSVVNEQFKDDCIQWNEYNTFDEECESVVKMIVNDVRSEGLLPDDICVICLDMKSISSYYEKITIGLRQNDIEVFNMLSAPNTNRRFRYEKNVTLATLNKAKGNESGMVYIVGADVISKNHNNVIFRNKLFTAITRAKGWVSLSGTGIGSLCQLENELLKLKKNGYKMSFIQPSENQTRTVMDESLKQQESIEKVKQALKDLASTGLSMEDVFDMLKDK